jgi:hypothetical protein
MSAQSPGFIVYTRGRGTFSGGDLLLAVENPGR